VGLWAVATRQTNIIWVAFTIAVSIIRELKEVDIVQLEEEEKSELPRGWMLYDPPAIDAVFPHDYIFAIRQCLLVAVSNLSVILPILLSFAPIFVAAVAFLFWNGGIVLGSFVHLYHVNEVGDKSNHIAGVNVPQMFYCTAFIAAFSAPILLRVVYLKLFLTSVFLNIRSAMTFWVTTGLILLTVHLNTYTLN
jgi:alpha-1,2-glucosyltransferase